MNESQRQSSDDAVVPRADSVIVAIAAGTLLGLIMIAQGARGRAGEPTFIYAMHSPNDRSRFVTIRALVDHGTYAVGSINDDGSYTDESLLKQPGWDTIDKVRRPDNGLLYSSKPPLLPTLLAGEYWLLKKIPTISFSRDEGWQHTGQLDFQNHSLALVRIIVATANWIPFVFFLVLFSRLLDRLTANLWVRAFALGAAGFGTYLTGFSVTLNNHTIAAFFGFFALYAVIRIWADGRREWWRFALAGFCASFAAVCELPAASLAAALAVGLAWKAPRRTLSAFVTAALLPVAGHFGTTYLATGGWSPAYAHVNWYDFPGSYWKVDPDTGRLVGTKLDPDTKQPVIDRRGIDTLYEPWPVYLFHMTLGHHGILSLSPIFILSLVGLIRILIGRAGSFAGTSGPPVEGVGVGQSRSPSLIERFVADPIRLLGFVAAAITIVVFIFYLFFAGQRNYGGMTNGLRWLFWLIPLWLVFLPAGLEWKAWCPRFRCIALVLLVLSAVSSFYATRNPWTRPWLHEVLNQAGWIPY